jgi:hypothetical protein
MNKALLQLAVAFWLVAAGTLCLHRFACDGAGAEESDLHLLPVAVGEYLEGVALSTDLQTRLESNHRRIQAKYEVVCELLANRSTLLEAAARFRDLDAGLPEVRDCLVQQNPGVPYELALCRYVIEHARSVLRVRAPDQVENLVARLEAELQAHLECETDLRLP